MKAELITKIVDYLDKDRNPVKTEDDARYIITTNFDKNGEIKSKTTEVVVNQLKHRKDIPLRQASKFKPQTDAKADEDGNFWITIHGKKIPFKEGEEMADKIDGIVDSTTKKDSTPLQTIEKNMSEKDTATLREISLDVNNTLYAGILDEIGSELDAELENVEISSANPSYSTRGKRKLYGSDVVIKTESLPEYERILKKAKLLSPTIQKYEPKVKKANDIIKTRLDKTKTVHRAMDITEISSIIKNNGKVGLQKRYKYGAELNFLSTSVNFSSAEGFLENHRDPILVTMNVSKMNKSDYQPVDYQLRTDIKVNDEEGNDRRYRPHEKYGGNHSAAYLREAEVHLKSGSTPIIESISVPGPMSDEEKEDLEKTVKLLEKINDKPITLKYTHGVKTALQNKEEDRKEKNIQRMMKEMGISRETAIMDIHRWS